MGPLVWGKCLRGCGFCDIFGYLLRFTLWPLFFEIWLVFTTVSSLSYVIFMSRVMIISPMQDLLIRTNDAAWL